MYNRDEKKDEEHEEFIDGVGVTDNSIDDLDLIVQDDDSHVDREGVTMTEGEESPSHSSKDTADGKESTPRQIVGIKACLLLTLIVSTVTVSILVYRYTKDAEINDFTSHYYECAENFSWRFFHLVDMKFVSARIISKMYTSRFDADDWPFVFMPDFEDQFSDLESLTHGSRYVTFSALVTDDNLESWCNYTKDRYEDEDYGDNLLGHLWKVAENNNSIIHDSGPSPYFGVSQIYPIENSNDAIMHNQRSVPEFQNQIDDMVARQVPTVSDFSFRDYYQENSSKPMESTPTSSVFFPIFGSFDGSGIVSERDIVGLISIEFEWERFFDDNLSDSHGGIYCVVSCASGNKVTYLVNGETVHLVGQGDHHEQKYDGMGVHRKYTYSEGESTSSSTNGRLRRTKDTRPYKDSQINVNTQDNDEVIALSVYPSSMFEDSYCTKKPGLYTFYVVLIFFFTAGLYLIYDCLVQRRQRRTMMRAVNSGKVVRSLFPEHVRERMFQQGEANILETDPTESVVPTTVVTVIDSGRQVKRNSTRSVNSRMETPSYKLNTFLRQDTSTHDRKILENTGEAEPIADLFPNVTVMFADIAGFTAWSSQREPTEVFKLLEAVYKTFDCIARKRGVFKVETIGDSYVAVAGLPTPNENHALVMARFAIECRYWVSRVTRDLETELGPGTAHLAMRFGLHSGPVIAGVLRGDKARFQLFGDTVNTAARMESTGERDRIQISQETADLLREAEKGHWLSSREDRVVPKGKGEMQTYWLVTESRQRRPSMFASANNSITESSLNCSDDHIRKRRDSFESERSTESANVVNHEVKLPENNLVNSVWKASEKWSDYNSTEFFNLRNAKSRLINWNTAVLEKFLVNVVASRDGSSADSSASQLWFKKPSESYLDEVVDAVEFTGFKSQLEHPELTALDSVARSQLREYVGRVAAFYRDVPFHNFEHASHVTMSASKLMKRIITPTDVDFADAQEAEEELMRNEEARLHEATFGISSDPLAQFAIVFSALVHDVDHRGVPNTMLVAEDDEVASRFNCKSVLEQNSIDVAWGLLTMPCFTELRNCICATESEIVRFRQLLINSVVATDIADKERSAMGKERWNKCFNDQARGQILTPIGRNRKATVVLEQIIQASDVAHTMQHWHAFIKWNEKLYHELYAAFVEGRSDSDPSDPEKWYKSEIGFFDFYVIPLARKLKQSGVFRAAGDEYLNYALANRQEWIEKGMDVVQDWKTLLNESDSE